MYLLPTWIPYCQLVLDRALGTSKPLNHCSLLPDCSLLHTYVPVLKRDVNLTMDFITEVTILLLSFQISQCGSQNLALSDPDFLLASSVTCLGSALTLCHALSYVWTLACLFAPRTHLFWAPMTVKTFSPWLNVGAPHLCLLLGSYSGLLYVL